jgi:sulfite exporter TauE/SafE
VSGELSYLLAFTTGLFGAPHCLGMCTGLAGSVFVHQGLTRRGVPAVLYHAGRVATYVALGVAGGLLGRVLVQSGAFGKGQGLLMIAAGLVVIVLGLGLAGALPFARPARCRPSLHRPVPAQSGARPLLTALLAGVGNGLVPCSLVFSVAIKASALADPLQAGALMLVFGLGTVPTMLGVSLLGGLLGNAARGAQLRIAGLLVVALGLWTLYEGIVFYDVMRGLAD